jgi:hypothetical protein
VLILISPPISCVGDTINGLSVERGQHTNIDHDNHISGSRMMICNTGFEMLGIGAKPNEK